jgi:hypothetical protein
MLKSAAGSARSVTASSPRAARRRRRLGPSVAAVGEFETAAVIDASWEQDAFRWCRNAGFVLLRFAGAG